MTTKKPLNFEKSLQELTTIVEKMESGELELEQSLQAFEQGIKLIRTCQTSLKQAEQRVEILTKDNKLQPFTSENSE